MSEAELERARARDLGDAVREAHILITTGAGGVGKTTIAAALGLAGARAGRRTLVLTIDPARRLAQAMGIERLENEPARVDLDGPGELHAMMLNMQRTFDEVVDRHAPSRDRAEAIKANRIYQTLSSTLSGTQEYMAMEKLYELDATGRWDLLVVDTPPTRSALDFLDAPRRMTDFLEGRVLKALMRPGMAAGKGITKVVGFGTQAFMRVASKVSGMDLLEDIADFFRNFEGMYEGFKERAEEVRHLLRQPSSQFVVVASPQPPPLRESRFFLERMQQEGLHAAGVAVNRVHPPCGGCPEEEDLRSAAELLERGASGAGSSQDGEDAGTDEHRAVAAALRLLADIGNLAVRERRDISSALYGLNPPALVEVPLLSSDIHDVSALRAISDVLTGGETRLDAEPAIAR
jgi:anion-transporting  ArsA/GET3 family ATPase